MSFYDRRILPHLINFAMGRDDVTRLRAAHVSSARGRVLEIGVGSGLNLPFYTRGVTSVHGVDASPQLLAMAETRAAQAPFPVTLINQNAECLSFDDQTMDTVVVTWSLCSIGDAPAALREMRRVLSSSGTLIFAEHGLSPDAEVRKWQNRLTPIWRHLAGGCHLNRKIDDLVRNAGFAIDQLDTAYIPGPRALTFMYAGVARASH